MNAKTARKLPSWTIDPQTGTVSKVGPFSHGLGPVEVQAATKGEATALLLGRYARQCAADGPKLFFRNGAYAMVRHDGNGWTGESGTCHPRRAMSDGSMLPLCSGGTFDRAADALKHCSFDYYAGEEFQRGERGSYGPLGTVESDLRVALRDIDSAYDESAKHGHPIAANMHGAIMRARATLAKLNWTDPTGAETAIATA